MADQPDRLICVLRRKLIGLRGAFLKGLGPVTLEHQSGGALDVDLGITRRNVHARDRQKSNVRGRLRNPCSLPVFTVAPQSDSFGQ
jgi:hypothetical protein